MNVVNVLPLMYFAVGALVLWSVRTNQASINDYLAKAVRIRPELKEEWVKSARAFGEEPQTRTLRANLFLVVAWPYTLLFLFALMRMVKSYEQFERDSRSDNGAVLDARNVVHLAASLKKERVEDTCEYVRRLHYAPFTYDELSFFDAFAGVAQKLVPLNSTFRRSAEEASWTGKLSSDASIAIEFELCRRLLVNTRLFLSDDTVVLAKIVLKRPETLSGHGSVVAEYGELFVEYEREMSGDGHAWSRAIAHEELEGETELSKAYDIVVRLTYMLNGWSDEEIDRMLLEDADDDDDDDDDDGDDVV